jgi:hypothetical protein
LKILEDGDESEIGERGVSIWHLFPTYSDIYCLFLSRLIYQEGKRLEVITQLLDFFSRFEKLVLVSLARAVYSRASLLILDDVLSAGQY